MSVLSFYVFFLRFSEVVVLKRSDIDFKDDCIELKLRSGRLINIAPEIQCAYTVVNGLDCFWIKIASSDFFWIGQVKTMDRSPDLDALRRKYMWHFKKFLPHGTFECLFFPYIQNNSLVIIFITKKSEVGSQNLNVHQHIPEIYRKIERIFQFKYIYNTLKYVWVSLPRCCQAH